MANHRSSGIDGATWDAPLIDGAPARTLVVPAYAALTIGFAAAATMFLLNIVAPDLINVRRGSPVAIVVLVVFFGSEVSAWVLFGTLFRQWNREVSAGYTTMTWRSVRGLIPVVNPRTRLIEHRGPEFDPIVARARVPWSTQSGDQRPSTIPSSSPFSRHTKRARWAGIAGIVLMGLAIFARVQAGTISSATSLYIGAVVTLVLVLGVLVGAVILRFVLADRLSKVHQVAAGIMVGAISTPDTRASSDRLNVPAGALPMVAVLVFDEDNFTIWNGSGSPRPVISVHCSNVLSLETTTIVSGRTITPGLRIAVIPPDERWPLLLDFTIFDPSRLFAAADEEKLTSIIHSITEVWKTRVP